MKIAIWHNLPSGGGKRALYDHVRGLVERGHKVESWCPSTADQTYLPLSELIAEHIVPFEWQPRSAIGRLSRLLSPYRALINRMDRHCQQCAEEINQGEFDLLFANACRFFAVTSIGRYVRIPKVIYLPEPHRPLYEAMPKLRWIAIDNADGLRISLGYLKDLLWDQIKVYGLRIQAREEFLNAHAFDTILVNSLFSRESVLRVYGLDAKVCYLGIDTQKFIKRNRRKKDFVVGLGSVIPTKNVSFVIEALGKIDHPRPKLVWIGNEANPYYLEEVRRLANSFGVSFEPKIRIDDGELVEILNCARMLVYPPRLEPFGLAPLEANACGLPVIAVAEGGVRETIIDGLNGIHVEHDPLALAAAIQRLMSDKPYANRLGHMGRCSVLEHWSLDAATDRLERKLEEAVDKSPQYTIVSNGNGDLALASASGQGKRVVADAVLGYVEEVKKHNGYWQFKGWAVDTKCSRTVNNIVVFMNGKSIFMGKTSVVRQDVATHFNSPALTETGYCFKIRLNKIEESNGTSIRLFAISDDGFASELYYPKKYQWGP